MALFPNKLAFKHKNGKPVNCSYKIASLCEMHSFICDTKNLSVGQLAFCNTHFPPENGIEAQKWHSITFFGD